MKKWMLLLSPVLFMNIAADAWGGRSINSPANGKNADATNDTYFPFNSDQGWFVDQSYLLLKPTFTNFDYGDLVTATGSDSNQTFKIKVKSPDFEWNSGVRLGLGRYLPHHDKWDISFYTTYFYGSVQDSAHGKLSQSKALAVSVDPFVFVASEDTETSWRLNYFVWDLMTGREFSMTPRITFHPYGGLRGTLMYIDFSSKNSGQVSLLINGPGNPFNDKVKIKQRENFWGIGPHIGSNFEYKFSGNWSFLGNLAASLLYGHYNVKEESNILGRLNSKAYDKNDVIRANLDAGIGLGWEGWFQHNTVRVAPNVMFEGAYWFDLNDFFMPFTIFSQDRGDLALMGLTFNLQVDF